MYATKRTRFSSITTATAILGAIAIGLGACGGSNSSASSSSTSTHSGSTVPAPPPASATIATPPATTASTTTPSSGPGTTVPGTKLTAGQTAMVLYTPPLTTGKKFMLKVTVESIQKGTLADFNGIQLDAAQKASTPVYVKVRLSDLSPGNASTSNNDPSVAINGVDNTGQQQQSVTFFGTFPRCNSVSAPQPFTQGKSFETCLTFMVPGGITKAAWIGTDRYISSPVTWAP
ncbi:MAG: hypothetical protein M3018_07545 [Actinomycetota bacterium]|nr:hypothetical protein [Actinomycetota bacterium]